MKMLLENKLVLKPTNLNETSALFEGLLGWHLRGRCGMFVDTIHQVCFSTNIRQIDNFNLRLRAHKVEHYRDVDETTKFLKRVDVYVHVVFECDDGQTVSVDMPDLL